jgi:hypothetical protein
VGHVHVRRRAVAARFQLRAVLVDIEKVDRKLPRLMMEPEMESVRQQAFEKWRNLILRNLFRSPGLRFDIEVIDIEPPGAAHNLVLLYAEGSEDQESDGGIGDSEAPSVEDIESRWAAVIARSGPDRSNFE